MFSFTVYDLFEKNLPHGCNDSAICDKTRVLNYGELAENIDRAAAWLHSVGIERGDRIGIHLPKSAHEIVATFAAARIGAVFVNINYQWTFSQLGYIIRDCGIRALFTDTRRASQIADSILADEIEHILVHGESPDHKNMAEWDRLPTPNSLPSNPSIDRDLAALLYTSGSTGKPKGVMFSHKNIVLGARIVAKYLGNSSEDRILGLLPMSFDYGLNQVMSMFLVGGCVVLQYVSLPAEIIKTIREQRLTGAALVAPSWVQLVRYLEKVPVKFTELRYITNSGGKIPLRVLQAMSRVFPGVDIYLMYGLTEAFRSTFLHPALFNKKMGSIGKAIPNTEVFVVDPDKGICGPGEQGELIHRGELISLGYWNNAVATNEKIKINKYLLPIIGDEKVLHSGDIVQLDVDGDLWFIGRTDDMIKSSGFRLSPTEVEEILNKHNDICETVAFGVEDDELGQVVHVAVAGDGQNCLNIDNIKQFCILNMPKYMVPRKIYTLTKAMPRTATGKIDRKSVIAECHALNAITI